MNIIFDQEQQVFHLYNNKISYIMKLFHDGYLSHLYYGSKLDQINSNVCVYFTEREGAPQPDGLQDARLFSLDTLLQEYPSYGCGDFRIPAIEARLANGTSALDFRYKSHQIIKGKEALDNLPSSHVDNDKALTLAIRMQEVAGELELTLYYTIIEDESLILRHSVIKNIGNAPVRLGQLASFCLDFYDCDFERIHLHGAHANERNIQRSKLNVGIDVISSARGASSHQHNPFVALVRPDCTEHNGEVYAASLVWSGNFSAQVEVSSFENTRLVMGINSFDFEYKLDVNESFTSPEAVLVYSNQGLNDMSNTFHHFVREHILPKKWAKTLRPVLVNSWEAAYFNFTQESIVRFAKDAIKLGAELIVLDDGWFGHRDDDTTSLGDWDILNSKKLPNGIKGLCDEIHSLGAKFGLWVEPEMISPDSNLFRNHPDWALAVPNHKRSQQRNQYVLDLSRKDVRDYIVDVICKVLASADIDYVKWDMNRNLTEIGSVLLDSDRQGEVATRYVLGVYDIMHRITSRFPNILFESCAGGGRRFDLGLLCYMPQVWTSDNTDAVCRQAIQYGTSLVYPPITMGSHVSAVPNHQVGRSTPMLTRFICAMSGNFGYEMDLGKLGEAEQAEVKEHIALYKQLRETIQLGKFIRLISPFENTKNETAWSFVSLDTNTVVLMYFKNTSKPAPNLRRVYLKGLDASAKYKVYKHLATKQVAYNDFLKARNLEGEILSGSELMYAGLTMDRIDADYSSVLVVLHKQA